MNEKILEQINKDKEVLSVLPKNNIKNKQLYIEKVVEYIENYNNLKESIYNEIKIRNNNLKINFVDNEIQELKDRIENIKGIMYLYNDYMSSMAKSSLDIWLYKLSCFNKLNLEDVNKCIYEIIKCFHNVSINIDKSSFKYNIFAYEYMNVYFDEVKDNNFINDKIVDCFEQIYWKCPDIIIHLKLSFIYLYYNNIRRFNTYYKCLKESNSFDINAYYSLVAKYDDKVNMDISILLSKFKNKELNIKDYTSDKINKIFKDLTDFDSYSNDECLDIIKLSHTLKEYKNYLDFKFIIEDMRKLYEQKNSFKDASKTIWKDIIKNEKVLFKYNKKVFNLLDNNKQKRLFKLWKKDNNDNKINEYNIAINNMIKELDNLYISLDFSIFKESIYNNVTDSSTIYDVLLLVSSNYNYLVNLIKTNNENITDIEIGNIREKLLTLLNSPYNTIINNIAFLFDGDIATIIRDKYNLLGIKIDNSNLEDSSISNFITLIDSILTYRCIVNSVVSVEDITFIVNSMNILQE